MSFKSFLRHVGHDLKIGLDFILPVGGAAVNIFAPGLGPMFRATAGAVVLAEQKAATLKQEKNGPQKLADVLQLMEPVIAQGLADAGKPNDRASVIRYIDSVVLMLNSAPAPEG